MGPKPLPKSYYKWKIHKIFEENTRLVKAISAGQNLGPLLVLSQEEVFTTIKEVMRDYDYVSITIFGRRVYDRAFALIYNLDGYPKLQEEYLSKMLFNPLGCTKTDCDLLRHKLEKVR